MLALRTIVMMVDGRQDSRSWRTNRRRPSGQSWRRRPRWRPAARRRSRIGPSSWCSPGGCSQTPRIGAGVTGRLRPGQMGSLPLPTAPPNRPGPHELRPPDDGHVVPQHERTVSGLALRPTPAVTRTRSPTRGHHCSVAIASLRLDG
jgi:hypothetical protein